MLLFDPVDLSLLEFFLFVLFFLIFIIVFSISIHLQ